MAAKCRKAMEENNTISAMKMAAGTY